jgi:hypothetical protein
MILATADGCGTTEIKRRAISFTLASCYSTPGQARPHHMEST